MDFIFDPSLVLYLPLYKLDGASFMSRDAYGHLCTVTGAVWTPQGRDFDGNDDYITQATFLDTMPSALTIEMWAKAQGGAGTERPLFQKENVIGQDRIWASIAGANNTLWFSTEGGNLGAKSVNGGDLSLDAWYHLVSIYEAGKALKCYVNTVESTGATADTIGDGTAEDFYIGNVWAKNLAWDGLIPEVRIYNRALTPLEIQHNYLATKWRYR